MVWPYRPNHGPARDSECTVTYRRAAALTHNLAVAYFVLKGQAGERLQRPT